MGSLKFITLIALVFFIGVWSAGCKPCEAPSTTTTEEATGDTTPPVSKSFGGSRVMCTPKEGQVCRLMRHHIDGAYYYGCDCIDTIE